MGLQFEPISGLTTAHVGLLWQRFRSHLPMIEEHPPLPPVIEKFEPPTPAHVEISIEDKPPAPRVWFVNESKSELVQVQPDRFIHNWRKTEGMEAYPRYEPIRDKFMEEAAVFAGFLADEGLEPLALNQCEVSYVNHIEPTGMWGRHGELEKIFRVWAGLSVGSFLTVPEDAGLRLRFAILNAKGEPVGRLHASVQPAWKRVDGSPILILNLTARGRPLGEGIGGAFDFLDLGREWIVRGFADLTTPEMHAVWERTDV